MRANIDFSDKAFGKLHDFFLNEVAQGFFTTDPAGKEFVVVREHQFLPAWMQAQLFFKDDQGVFKSIFESAEINPKTYNGDLFFHPGAIKAVDLPLFFYMTCKGTWVANYDGKVRIGGHRAAFRGILTRAGLNPDYKDNYRHYEYAEGGTNAEWIKPWQIVMKENQGALLNQMHTKAAREFGLDINEERRFLGASADQRSAAIPLLRKISGHEKKADILKTLREYRGSDEWKQNRRAKFLDADDCLGKGWKPLIGPIFAIGFFPRVDIMLENAPAMAPARKKPQTKSIKLADANAESIKQALGATPRAAGASLEEFEAPVVVEAKLSPEDDAKTVERLVEIVRNRGVSQEWANDLVAGTAGLTLATPVERVYWLLNNGLAVMKLAHSMTEVPVDAVSQPKGKRYTEAEMVNLRAGIGQAQVRKFLLALDDAYPLEDSYGLMEGESFASRGAKVEAIKTMLNHAAVMLNHSLPEFKTPLERLEVNQVAQFESLSSIYLVLVGLAAAFCAEKSIETIGTEFAEAFMKKVNGMKRVHIDSIPGMLIQAFKGTTDVNSTRTQLALLRHVAAQCGDIKGPLGDMIKMLKGVDDAVVNEALNLATPATV